MDYKNDFFSNENLSIINLNEFLKAWLNALNAIKAKIVYVLL